MDRFSRSLNRAVEWSLFGMGFSMALLVAVQVVCRYLLNHSLFWSEEVARILLVWISFLGASVAYRRGVNPSVSFVTDRLAPSVQRIVAVLVHLLAAVFFVVLVIYGYNFAAFVAKQITPALGIPKWIPHSIMPISGALMLIHALAFLTGGGKEGRDDG